MEELTEEKRRAAIIYQQFGGNRAKAMIGIVTPIACDKDGIYFRFKAKALRGANVCRIKLTPADTYTMEILRLRAGQIKSLDTFNDVYFDMLQPVFERATGLRLSL